MDRATDLKMSSGVSEKRILILLPSGRDAEHMVSMLKTFGIEGVACGSIPELCQESGRSVGAIVTTDDVASTDPSSPLGVVLREQPTWSTIPVILLSGDREEHSGNIHDIPPGVTLLDRPVRMRTLGSAVRSALLTRHQQYELRDSIAERARQAAALKESEARFRLMADTAPVLIWVSGPDKEGVYFNQPWLNFTGRSLGEELGDGWLKGVHPDDLPLMTECDLAFHERRPFTLQFRLRRSDGLFRWVNDTGVPRHAPDGSFVGFIGTCVDITEQREYQESLRQADRMKNEFIATLAHELRNPLAPIRTGLEVLRFAPSGEHATRAREIMERQVAHMVRLIDDLLDVSRISTGKLEIRRESVALSTIIKAALEANQPLFNTAQQSVTASLGDEDAILNGDPTRLAQVLGNLLTNASKYTPGGGEILIKVQLLPNAARVDVIDSGVGIAPDMIPRVFDMFCQVKGDVGKAQGGLGIGLTLARRLTEMHGGTLEASSAGIGKGSTFTVTLPRVPSKRSDVGTLPPHERAATTPTQKHLKILIVEDNKDVAQSLNILLSIMGHHTVVAHTGPEALEAAERLPPDIIFLDIGLPGMDGYEVARQLRAKPQTSHTNLIAVTGWGSEADRLRAKEAGFNRHITKPMEPEEVERLVEEQALRSS
jgi:two-component system CheB/CheR fusion protein